MRLATNLHALLTAAPHLERSVIPHTLLSRLRGLFHQPKPHLRGQIVRKKGRAA